MLYETDWAPSFCKVLRTKAPPKAPLISGHLSINAFEELNSTKQSKY